MNLYREEYGDGLPIFFFHGYGIDHQPLKRLFEPIFEELGHRSGAGKAEFKRIYFDLPCMGKSDFSKKIVDADLMIEPIAALIDEVGGKNYALVGSSYGGYLARWFIRHRPNAVVGALFDIPVIKPYRKDRDLPAPFAFETDEVFIKTLSEKERTNFFPYTTIRTPAVHERVSAAFKGVRRIGATSSGKQFMKKFMECGYSFSDDTDKPAAPFDGPVTFVCGRYDSVTGYRDALGIIDNFTDAHVHIITAGHNLEFEQNELFTSLFIDWLARLSRFAAKR